ADVDVSAILAAGVELEPVTFGAKAACVGHAVSHHPDPEHRGVDPVEAVVLDGEELAHRDTVAESPVRAEHPATPAASWSLGQERRDVGQEDLVVAAVAGAAGAAVAG